MSFDPELFRAVSFQDLTMPGGWSVSSGQTFLYTPEEQRLMREARAFVQHEILPKSAEAHRRAREIKAQHPPGPERRRLLREMARAYLRLIGEAGPTRPAFPPGSGRRRPGAGPERNRRPEIPPAGRTRTRTPRNQSQTQIS